MNTSSLVFDFDIVKDNLGKVETIFAKIDNIFYSIKAVYGYIVGYQACYYNDYDIEIIVNRDIIQVDDNTVEVSVYDGLHKDVRHILELAGYSVIVSNKF